jgi:hypothetical protein
MKLLGIARQDFCVMELLLTSRIPQVLMTVWS